MKKIRNTIISFFIVFFSINSNSYSEVVNKVQVEGNSRITLETIKIFGDIVEGRDYDSSGINLIIKKLYDSTFFSNISVSLENGLLTLVVEENPIINTISFEGEKANKYKETISEMLTLREKTSYRSSFIKSDINIIKEAYRSLGYYFVEIDAKVEKLNKNMVNIVYLIDKKEKAKISKIYFLGDKKVRDKKLRDIITSQESKFWKFLSRNVYLNQGRVELDKRLLTSYYKNKGYYEADISSSNVEYSEGEGFVLTYTINAGNRYRFKKIFANVSESLDKTPFISLEKDFNKVIGDYYSQRALTQILKKIDKLSEQKELQFINHRVSETLSDDSIEIQIDIFEGQKFLVERINIIGNSVTNDSVIRSELIIDEGDPYSALLVNKSVNKLKARGIFGEITSKVIDGSSPDLKTLEITVEERATGEISAGAGVGTDGTAFMAAVSENNWLGRGIKLKSSLNISEKTISGDISVTNPNYKFTGNSVSGGLNLASTDQTSTSGYESTNTGISLATEFQQYENIYIAPGIEAAYEDVEVQSSASKAVKDMQGNFTNVDFLYAITVDKRDQPFQPTEGYRAKFRQSLPMIMDSSSIDNNIDISTYHPISEDVIGSIKLYARSVHAVDKDNVRLTERLFLPQKRLRGFNVLKVGPKDGEDYIGGNYTTAMGFEAQLPNLLPESTRTDISLFLDTGNVWEVDYSSSLDDASGIRSAVGFAANTWTPVGPLSFTLAQDLSKEINDETESFSFRIGTSF